jgi:glycerophosphoryl diester phosphodiesterase
LEEFLDCLSRAHVTLVEAHRGGPSPGYPENALATFAHTLSLAPAMLEVDIAATRDGRLVLMHDDQLDRTTDCAGGVAEHTWAELQGCRLKDDDGRLTDDPIPLLDDVLTWTDGKTVLELDMKSSVRYEDVIDAVRRTHAETRVILISRTAAQAGRLAHLAPHFVISASIGSLDDLAEVKAAGVSEAELVAWTGNQAPKRVLNAQLDVREIPVIFGTLGDREHSIDAEIARTGQEQRYREIAAADGDIIATDRAVAAYQSLAAASNIPEALESCGSK